MQYFVVNIRTTTFNLPDFRGAFLRMVGGNSGSVGTLQEDAIRNISGSVGGLKGVIHETSGAITSYVYQNEGVYGDGVGGYTNTTFNASRVVPTADENRPVNYAVQYFIKY